jgi:gp16 family phage-associated protein
MVRVPNRKRNSKSHQGNPANSLRAALLREGHSVRSWAEARGVSDTLVHRIVRGKRPGKRGRSGTIRREIDAILSRQGVRS